MAQDLPRKFGSYTLHELIDRGGMAEIYRATMPGIGGFEKTVAIKKILPHLAEDDEFITMLIDEAQIIVSIDHYNIAQVYDLGRIEDSYYIAMEYIHGPDLADVIDKMSEQGRTVPVPHAVYIGSCICAGLHVAHSKTDEDGNPLNIVHRDVSPHNVLLSYAGDVKIIDFGVAKASTKRTETEVGVIKGKLLYMAPEQAKAEDVDGRSDLFAAGLIIYKMLTNKLPFAGETDFEIYNNILEKEVTPPAVINPEVPRAVNDVVMKLLARDPDDRYQEGYAAKQDLDKALHQMAPGYTVNRLSRFIDEHFAQQQAGETGSGPADIPPNTPSASNVTTDTNEPVEPTPEPISEGEGQLDFGAEKVTEGISIEQQATAQATPPAQERSPQPQSQSTPPPESATGDPGHVQAPAPKLAGAEEESDSSDSKSIPTAAIAIALMALIVGGLGAGVFLLDVGADESDEQAPMIDPSAIAEPADVVLETTPEGARVSRDGDLVGITPIELTIPPGNRGMEFEFELDGYETHRVELDSTDGGTHHFELTAVDPDESPPEEVAEAELNEDGEDIGDGEGIEDGEDIGDGEGIEDDEGIEDGEGIEDEDDRQPTEPVDQDRDEPAPEPTPQPDPPSEPDESADDPDPDDSVSADDEDDAVEEEDSGSGFVVPPQADDEPDETAPEEEEEEEEDDDLFDPFGD